MNHTDDIARVRGVLRARNALIDEISTAADALEDLITRPTDAMTDDEKAAHMLAQNRASLRMRTLAGRLLNCGTVGLRAAAEHYVRISGAVVRGA